MNEDTNKINFLKLIEASKRASQFAHCPLSNFRVGAAILDAYGSIFLGCNVEFDNYSNTLHAEEVAIGSMIIAGRKNPIAIAVYTKTGDFPCGMCRQSLYEIGGDGLVVLACNDTTTQRKTIAELVPNGFKLSHDNPKKDKI